MNLLEIYPNFSLRQGGVQRQIYDLCIGSIERGHRPMVLTWTQSASSTEIIDGILVKRTYVPRLFSVLRHPMILYLSLYMLFIVKKHRINVIHAHDYLPGLSAALAGLLSHTPTIVTFHLPVQYTTFHLPSYLLPAVLVEKILKRCFDFWVGSILCVSKFTCKETLKLGFPQYKLKIIYNWTTFSDVAKKPKSATLNKLNLSRKPFILAVGRLEENQKCFSLLIRAFKLLLNKGYAFDLVIVGEGPYKEAYQKCAMSCHIEYRVHFLSNILDEDLANLYQTCELFVFPSHFEGLPLVLLEAMHYGRPVVATAVGGIPEIIENGYNGFLVNPDPNSIVLGIEKILSQPSLKTVFGNRSQEIVSKKFPHRNLETSILLLEKLANNKTNIWNT